MSYESIKRNFDKERIHVVEIDTPRCIYTLGTSPCLSAATGNNKCYNTRSTCKDDSLAGGGFAYNDQITFTGSISASATGSSFTATGSNFISLGFVVGDIITTEGFTNAGNNSQFEITFVSNTVIVVKSNSGMVNESSASGRSISKTNIYTYKHCTSRAPHPFNMNNYAPCVDSVSVAPAKIDPKGGIGARTSVSMSFADFPSSDRYGIDPYLSDRTYNPLDVGSYWNKFRVRHANYENYPIRILTGYIVNDSFDEANFETRHYVLSTLNASGGQASIKAKDPLQLVSNKDALYPKPSRGQLSGDLPLANTSFTITPSGAGADYPASNFYVKIRNEVILVNTRSGDSFTSVTRAQFNTVADDHSEDDTVQLCIEYNGTLRLDQVVKEILEKGAGVPPIYIPCSAWRSEAELYLTSNPSRLLTDPTKVSKLQEQLSNEWPHQLYWNDRSRSIELRSIRIPEQGANYNTFDSNGQIMELSTKDNPELQLSTVFVRYGQFDPTKKEDETDNYRVSYGRVNIDAIARYDSNNAKIVNALWISALNGGQASKLAQIHGRRFGFTPREVNFMLEDKDSSLWLGDVVNINHYDITDANGFPVDTPVQVLSASESNGYDYNALEYKFDRLIPEIDFDVALNVVPISADLENINLRTAYESVFGAPDGTTEAFFVVESGVVVGSNSTASAAMITGTWPAGSTISLEVRSGGVIAGAGGNGADATGTNGANGGRALELTYDLTIVNNGVIGGGGGGGAADQDSSSLAAGGGGAGRISGLGGAGTTASGQEATTTQAQAGAVLTGGAGGIATTGGLEPSTAQGGKGGDIGQNGGGSGLGVGGSAGAGAVLNGNVLSLTGNAILGSVS